MRETAWVSRRMSKELRAGYPRGVREAALEAPVWPGDQGGLPREGPLRLRGKWEVAEVRWWKDRGMFPGRPGTGQVCGTKECPPGVI